MENLWSGNQDGRRDSSPESEAKEPPPPPGGGMKCRSHVAFLNNSDVRICPISYLKKCDGTPLKFGAHGEVDTVALRPATLCWTLVSSFVWLTDVK